MKLVSLEEFHVSVNQLVSFFFFSFLPGKISNFTFTTIVREKKRFKYNHTVRKIYLQNTDFKKTFKLCRKVRVYRISLPIGSYHRLKDNGKDDFSGCLF